MDEQRLNKLITAYFDEELDLSSQDELFKYLAENSDARLEFKALLALRKEMMKTKTPQLSDEDWEKQHRKLRRELGYRIGWFFLLVGFLIVIIYALYEFLCDGGVAGLYKTGLLAIIFGFLWLFIKVMIERKSELFNDPYKEVDK
jgi:hypothetical protein